jgi:hypothetical protein
MQIIVRDFTMVDPFPVAGRAADIGRETYVAAGRRDRREYGAANAVPPVAGHCRIFPQFAFPHRLPEPDCPHSARHPAMWSGGVAQPRPGLGARLLLPILERFLSLLLRLLSGGGCVIGLLASPRHLLRFPTAGFRGGLAFLPASVFSGPGRG